MLSPADLVRTEGQLVAVSTTEGHAFKRVGRSVPGARHLVQFEPIGGLGESMVARVEVVEDDPYDDVPIVTDARAVLGVLYEAFQGTYDSCVTQGA